MTYRKRTFFAFIVILALMGVAFIFGLRHPRQMALDASEAFDKNNGESEETLAGRSLLFVIAPKNFRDEELLTTKSILESKGVKATIASTTRDTVVGMLGAKVLPEKLISNVDLSKYDGVVFVGGSGTTMLWDNRTAHKLAVEAKESGKIVAAICFGPVILARAGILKNCNATVSPSVSEEIERYGAHYTGKPVAICGRIITANGPKSVELFAEAIEKLLMQMEK